MELAQEELAVFQTIREGILIIDCEAKISFCNQAYLDFLGTTRDAILGKPLRDIRPGARLPEVLKTGKPILHAPRREANDDVYFVNMYPIMQADIVVDRKSVV